MTVDLAKKKEAITRFFNLSDRPRACPFTWRWG